jgi:hypothetical protein
MRSASGDVVFSNMSDKHYDGYSAYRKANAQQNQKQEIKDQKF